MLPPLYSAVARARHLGRSHVTIHKESAQFFALQDLRTIFRLLYENPVKCRQLLPGEPDYIGSSDACKYGAGGVWFGGLQKLHPIVWRVPWPQDIIDRVSANELSINDLEMAGLVLQYLLLEQVVPMKHVHAAAWCDNSSAVSWTVKMSSSKSAVGQLLTRTLALRMISNKSSHLVALAIAGVDNCMADLASRSFKSTGSTGNFNLSNAAFLSKFNNEFPLSQDTSWIMLRLHDSVTSHIFTILRSKRPAMGSLLRVKAHASDIFESGQPSAASTTAWNRFLSLIHI